MNSRDEVYGAFLDFYGDIPMKYIKDIETNWILYGARVESGLSIYRYIFVIVDSRNSTGIMTTLDKLDWVSFQTRTSDELHKVPVVHIILDNRRKEALPDIINIVRRTQTETEYVTNNLPIRIRLLHDPKKNNYLQYPDSAKIYQALETYNCVIDLL